MSCSHLLFKVHLLFRIRTEGSSGVTLIRGGKPGFKNYESASHVSSSAFSIHDHSNYDRTIGQGEFGVVLNGVPFRTRHNDYKLVMASRHSMEYHDVEDIPFPGVPPEVINKSTLEEQIVEMREWFRAFHNQDRGIRDYTQYFKPVLCYLEGAWTLDESIQEPFASDRHSLDATSWMELHKRYRFFALSGAKSRQENNAFLPREIVSVNITTGELQFAQWNYRILCSPVEFDIPLSHFHQEDDLTFRVRTNHSLAGTEWTRAARFKLYDTTRKGNGQLLDDIFSSIPGKNNHGGNLSLTVFGEHMYDPAYTDSEVLLNSAYYHRSYKTIQPGAGGGEFAELGFNDGNLWTAMTTQSRVAPFEAEECNFVERKSVRHCQDGHLRVSYAIPLEVIYLSPLLSWNPYNLVLHNDKRDPADTVRDEMLVLDPEGKVRRVTASGTRIFLPEIPGVGKIKIRMRYPIAPVYGVGSSVWKELNALKDKLLGSTGSQPSSVVFQMSPTNVDPPDDHTHKFTVAYQDFSHLLAGQKINVTTEETQGHTHNLTIEFVPQKK
ncbi:unnamed protein product, partial [Candidula unifasciata]